MKILMTLVRHSHECRAKVRDKISKTVARNLLASEILGFYSLKTGMKGCASFLFFFIQNIDCGYSVKRF